MHYVGLDVHSRQSSLEMLDEQGKTVKRLTVRGPWPKLIEAVAALPQRPLAVAYEASCGYGYLHERLGRIADRVAVGHPGQMRLIFKSKRKHDRVDAGKIAKLLYLDMVPQVHVPAMNVRQWRRLIEFRQKLLQRRVMIKNQLRAILRSLAIVTPKGLTPNGLWSGKGQRWLAELELADAEALERDLLLEEMSDLNEKIKRVEKELAKIAQKHPAVTVLRSIPGVGIRTAEAFVAYVDDVWRFARTIQIGTYFGLVPCQDASASVNRLGHITREGPATVRKLLCEAAWQALRRSPTVRGWFERISGNDAGGRKIALVAVARKLAVVMGAMLRSGEVWREDPDA
jgi:transposase